MAKGGLEWRQKEHNKWQQTSHYDYQIYETGMTVSFPYQQIDFVQSSQLAVPLWTELGLKSGIGRCKLISTLKKKKKDQECFVKPSKILACEKKAYWLFCTKIKFLASFYYRSIDCIMCVREKFFLFWQVILTHFLHSSSIGEDDQLHQVEGSVTL